MDNSTIVFLINDDARAIAVKYEESGVAMLGKTFDQTIKVDDLVVIESGTRYGMTVAKVVEVDLDINFDTTTAVKWIVQKVDKDAFANVQRQEQVAISTVQAAERRRKKEQLRSSLFADHQDRIMALELSKTDDDLITK